MAFLKQHKRIVMFCFTAVFCLCMLYALIRPSDTYRNTWAEEDFQATSDNAMISKPFFLEAGTYRLTADSIQQPLTIRVVDTYTVDTDNQLAPVLVAYTLTPQTPTFTFTQASPSWQIQIQYTGQQPLTVHLISTKPVFSDAAFIVLIFAAIFALFSKLYLLDQKHGILDDDLNMPRTMVALILLAAALLSCLSVMRGYLAHAYDLVFHLTRIEGIKEGLLAGQFPVRISPVFGNEYGYATSVLYPELFLYLPAFFRLCGVSAMTNYQVLLFLIATVTAGITYRAVTRLTGKKTIGLIAAVVYTLCQYRVLHSCERGGIGEVLAMIFYPCVITGIWETLVEGKFSKWLIAGITGLIQTHLISLMIAVMGCALFMAGCLALRRTSMQALLQLIKAAGLVLLLNLWFLIPFFSFYALDLRIFFHTTKLYEYAIYFPQLFMMYVDPYGVRLKMGMTAGESPHSVGLLLGLGLLLLLLAWFQSRKQLPLKERPLQGPAAVSALLAALLLIMASTVFPWTYVNKIPVLGELLFSIQYPFRFLGAASALLAVVFAISAYLLFPQRSKVLVLACLVLAVINIMPLIDSLVHSDKQVVLFENKYEHTLPEVIHARDYYFNDTDYEDLAQRLLLIAA